MKLKTVQGNLMCEENNYYVGHMVIKKLNSHPITIKNKKQNHQQQL